MNQKQKRILKGNKGDYPLVMRIIAVAYGLFTMCGAWPNELPYYYKGHEIGLWGKWAMFAFGLLIFWCGIFYKRPMGGKAFH
ncbi:hypothetical protein SAMN06295933_0168 [Desulfovibrio gilichinskyi]|uniref:Uncharacterized protein n=1 Tax=Desulfovibrio gilichinskyi TaxID=1519643 RepID=A0A1X7C1W8_9BACT|nr:hypothetical protein SAMN06295933_0168 [Desulfovibrio gilichinskyi]